ncbi:M66 family metalloprotease [Gemmatimonas phototrophica]|uniref:Uncharacterized protein n=1 Tax=Gemmatimonas phototrophica TaxID=1379270 RepID=A0A143BGJ2_9BACT|nr:M66 family metalloprotease [Gemmatimonas phototrophica]AMW04167.1 hypothetical protein GEMMAAP_03615 [Gemmatimonas phototrophica]
MLARFAAVVSLGLLLSACSGDATAPVAPDPSTPIAKDNGLTGIVAVEVGGLPTTASANIVIVGPNGFERRLTTSGTVSGVPLGRYQVNVSPVSTPEGEWVPELATQELVISAAATVQAVRTSFRLSLRRSEIVVAVSGLPNGTPANITLSGPGGASAVVTGSDTIETTVTGEWTLVAQTVSAGGYSYSVTPSSQTGTLRSRDQLRFAAPYALSSGALAVSVSGLPVSASGTVTVTGPGGFTRALTSTTTLTGLTPGSYTVAASAVTVSGTTYQPAPASSVVEVTASLVAAAAPVTYSAVAAPSGTLVLSVTGVPVGANGSVLISGPNGYTRTMTQGSSIAGLTAGSYILSAQRVRTTLGTYDPSPASQIVNVPVGGTIAGTVNYSALPAVARVTLSGVPSGAAAAVQVTAPGVAPAQVSASTFISGTSGTWTLSAASIQSGGFSYAPTPTSSSQATLAGDTAQFPVAYAISTGAIAVSLSGVPAGGTAVVTVTGPNGFSRIVSATQTFTDLPPGSYTVSASAITVSGVTYQPSPATRTVSVTASQVAQAAPVSYASQTGSIVLTLAGLPAGAVGDVLVTGPNSYSQVVAQSTTLAALPTGTYTVVARTIRTTLGSYSGAVSAGTITVTTNTSSNSTATYSAMPAVVIINTSGVPSGGSAALTLTSPTNVVTNPTTSTTLSSAAAGRWRLTAASIVSGGSSYAPTPASYDQTVLAGDTLRFPVTYALSSGAIAVTVSGLPGATNGNVTVTGPNAFSRSVTATTTITNLTPGTYTVSASSVSASGISYTPSPTSRTVTVTASLVAQPAQVTYTGQFGRLTLSASGLPMGATPSFSLTGAATRSITGAVTTDSLPSGAYTITPATVVYSGSTYTPTPASANATVTTGGTSSASFSYAVSGGGGGSPNLMIENVYLTQAVQNWAGTTAMVVGRDALVRVFVRADAANSVRPSVRLRVYDNTTLLSTITIAAPATSVPTAISEGVLGSSWNTVIPAANVRAGLRILADIDPSNALGETNRTDNTWPSTGAPAAIATIDVAALDVRFVPVTVQGLTGNVSDANKEQYLELAKLIHPLKEVRATVRAPFTSSAAALQSGNGNGAWITVLNEMNALRAADGATSTLHYYGVVKATYGSGVAGYGNQPGRAAVGWDNFPSAKNIAAHELGHNFALAHAPCGVSGTSAYPYSGGVTGAWGWNSLTNSAVSPTATDIMGYCGNQWVSDWTWGRVAGWRAISGSVVSAGIEEGLLVWGHGGSSGYVLEPSFPVRTRATAEPARPTHEVELYDDMGVMIAHRLFMMDHVDHASEDVSEQFAVVVPLEASARERIARVVVRSLRSPLALVSAEGKRSALLLGGNDTIQSRELPATKITRVDGQRRQVSWDDRTFRMAMVRDRDTGQILAFLRKPGDSFVGGSNRIDVVLSDGVRSKKILF